MTTSPIDLTTEHLAALAATAAVAAALSVSGRRWPGRWIGPVAAALGLLIVASEAVWIAWLVAQRLWTPAIGLPLHICDMGTMLAAAALWTRRRALVELLWFWAIAGTLLAMLTPDIPQAYPGILWFQYYLAHGGIVAAALFLVIGLRIAPGRTAAVRAAALTLAYAAAVGAVDAITGGNYLYLRQPPLSPTLLNVMGPWPEYLVSATALGLVLFALLQAPFLRPVRTGDAAAVAAAGARDPL
jgi:hypothetical integral membrane protein (TIGR02206 family)